MELQQNMAQTAALSVSVTSTQVFLSPCFICSMLGDLDDRVEDFSDLEEEFRLEAPVTEWVERDWPESRPRQQRSLSQHRDEQLALLLLLRLVTSSFSKVS